MTDFSPDVVEAAIAAPKTAFYKAMLQARAEIPTIVKSIEAGGRYKYADLATVAQAVEPVLSRHGLGYHWDTETLPDGSVAVSCTIWHVDGHEHRTSLSAPSDTSGNKQPIQAMGSTITYLQRYTLLAALGVAVARDDDAARTGRTVTPSQVAQLVQASDGLDVLPLLEKLGIVEWEELQQSEFRRVMASIEAKKKGGSK